MMTLSPSAFGLSENDREIRCFQYFYERTAPALAGYSGSMFWSPFVLQVSQREKSIWHAIIALGSLHEDFEKGLNLIGLDFPPHGQDSFAIQEYLAAIRALLKLPGLTKSQATSNSPHGGFENVTLDVCLISCILFTCFEILSGHYTSAINHIRSGIGILREVYYDVRCATFRHSHLRPSTVSNLEIESIRKIFLYLHSQTSTLTRVEGHFPENGSSKMTETPYFPSEFPTTFTSIAEAGTSLDILKRSYVIHCRNIMQAVSVGKTPAMPEYLFEQIRIAFPRWCAAFFRLEESRGNSSVYTEQLGFKLIKIHQLHLTIYYEYAKAGEQALYKNENSPFSWDDYNGLFEEILSLVGDVIKTSSGVRASVSGHSLESFESVKHDSATQPLFCLDNGILVPLYEVATMCRDPVIRRKAVSILRLAPRQEGVFNSHLLAMAAEKAIEIEEAAASGGALDYHSVFGESKVKQERKTITKSSEIPDSVRLTYAFPKIDMVKRNISLTIGPSAKKEINIPWPDLNFLVENAR